MGLFSRSNNVEELERLQEYARAEILRKNLVLFPGNQQEYENFMGYDVEIIDTRRNDKGVTYKQLTEFNGHQSISDYGLREHLLSEGIEAILVQCPIIHSGEYSAYGEHYGLPIRKRENVPPEEFSL